MDFSRARDEGPAWEPTADKVLGLDQLADMGTGPAPPPDDDLQDLGDLTYAQLAQARGLDPEALDRLADLRLPRPSRTTDSGPHPSAGPSPTVSAPVSTVPAVASTVPAVASTVPAVASTVPAAASTVPGAAAPTVAARAPMVPAAAPTVAAAAPTMPAPAPIGPGLASMVPTSGLPAGKLPTWPPPGAVPTATADPITRSAETDESEPATRLRWRWSKRSGG
jgi:putative serine protease PepD